MKLSQLSFLTLRILGTCALFLSFLPVTIHAVSQSSIAVNIAPENPDPGESTTITLNSYSSNLDSVLISWSVNGKNIQSGIGKKSFTTTAPAAGAQTTITIAVFLPDGEIDKTVILRPAVMALLWEATDSYVPPFYKGKALPSLGSEIKVVAMPEIKAGTKMVNPRNMVYSWKKDYTNDPNGSGYGRNYYMYTNDYLEGSNTINVTATTTDQNYSSEKSVDITPGSPKILFYKIDPKLGTLWEEALYDGYKIFGEEMVRAAPYFISPKDIRIPSLEFSWFLDDLQIAVPSYSKTIMPLRVENGASGSSQLRLEIENMDKIYESASGKVNVKF